MPRIRRDVFHEIPREIDDAPRILRMVGVALSQQKLAPADALFLMARILEGEVSEFDGRSATPGWYRYAVKHRRVQRRVKQKVSDPETGIYAKPNVGTPEEERHKRRMIEQGLLNEDGSVIEDDDATG